MRIKADFDLCESNAICVGMAPDFFDLDDEDYLVILQEEIPADRVEELRQVAANCPKSALTVVED
ncbi:MULTISPECIES: ferredoxin [Gordonia]|jgi:ferredoxin|uniref:Ferredoxin n=1 Tax=Gordonia alkanivorans CGMCC 6845 TaxID=1423140 RepID=W9DF61_9ACTN|nr:MULTISPECIES: ferredoxin [Gordonia]ASR04744.1 Ferredoxin-2 [Gordonia rubripertincta]ETA07097.1 ferredoxin [Gordonia alkanivorans CGMCC 6845]MDH3008928.1 ferredoxin [Gordonia alkanivorans]MDH3017889.1 ferredoxin [Gordonia alkanivorans]MDH3022408.1 ferredoxin [Gordonia alkanivorans]